MALELLIRVLGSTAMALQMTRFARLRREILDETQVATPCAAKWEEMEGDDRVRFCGACKLHVYNLSAMDVDEAADLLMAKEERVCTRFYRRRDGTLLTQDCPVGSRQKASKSRVWEGVTATGVIALVALVAAPSFIPI